MKVLVLIPPAVELDDPPINISNSMSTITGTASVPVSTEANPAVRLMI